MKLRTDIPVLVDFDGVIRIGKEIIPGATAFFEFLDRYKIPFFIISNSTLTRGSDIKEKIISAGIKSDIKSMTTIDAAIDYLSGLNKRIKVYCSKEMEVHFREFIAEDKPDAVVIGDLGDKWSYDLLNGIFRDVYAGAEIIAMQKNKFWKPDGNRIALDAGAFIASIEYASSKSSVLIGKPSPIYFRTAIKKLGFPEGHKFIMIGDDIETDIAGAQKLDGTGILVFTGKTKQDYRTDYIIRPDYEADTVKDVITVLEQLLQLE